MKIRHFYHVGAGGAWRTPVREHRAAMAAAGLDCPVTAGITGHPAVVKVTAGRLAGEWPEAQIVPMEAGFEQRTLALARAWAGSNPDGLVLYAHAKGSFAVSQFSTAWRESMTAAVIGGWRRAVTMLDAGYDAAGPHWLHPDVYPNMLIAARVNGGSATPYFGGNFWWARASYLARLPEPDPDGSRYDAELWIGLGHPKVADLSPGWPHPMTFTGPTTSRALAVGSGNPAGWGAG